MSSVIIRDLRDAFVTSMGRPLPVNSFSQLLASDMRLLYYSPLLAPFRLPVA